MLAALIGVDFDVAGGAAPQPANWNVADFGTRQAGFDTLLQNNLIDELGEATPVELLITSPIAESEAGVLDFIDNDSIAAATLPSRLDGLPTLENLGGWQFVDGANQTITATWRNLSPFTRYDVFVFGLEGDGQNSSQSVNINDGEVLFTQSPTTSGAASRLWVNGQEGTTGLLDELAVQALPNSAGQIEILVTATSPRNSAALGGVAIRAAERLPILVNRLGDIDDGDRFNNQTTLREALAIANSRTEADQIVFDDTVFAAPTTLTLTGGELQVSESLTITGPGQALLTIDANEQSRVMNVVGGTEIDVSLAGVTLTGGRTTEDNLLFQTTHSGGGIRFDSVGTLKLTGSTVSGNSTAGRSAYGGGIASRSGAVTLTDSTVSGNRTEGWAAYGGGIFSDTGAVTLTRSSLSGNQTTGSIAHGGGIRIGSIAFGSSSELTLIDSTLSGNRVMGTDSDGGGIWFEQSSLTIINSTVTDNSATRFGGGLSRSIDEYDNFLSIQNSIIAGNMAGIHADLNAPLTNIFGSVYRHSLIGDNSGTLLPDATTADANGNLVGTSTDPIDPLLGPLAPNGGPTLTHALLAGSPAIDAGDNVRAVDSDGNPLTTDQRGTPFERIAGTTVDMGAVERQTLAASLFVVTTLDDELDYSNSEVSLREAINSANGSVGSDTITFDESLFTSGSASIVLTMGELQVGESLTITGPGQALLTIDANEQSRVLNVVGGTEIDVTLEGVTLTGGRTTEDNQFMSALGTTHSGGGIRFESSGTLTLTSSTVSGNSTSGSGADGGGISTSSGAVTLTDSTVSGNSTLGDYAYGGGIASRSGAVKLTDSTVSGNHTTGMYAHGGGISTFMGAVTLTGSIVSANSTAGEVGDGGGIRTFEGAISLANSTVSGNSTAGDRADGGGMRTLYGAVTLAGSTVSGNLTTGDSADGGGISLWFGALTVTGSTISGNQVTGADSDGGGIWVNDTVSTIVNSTITGNTAMRSGGGLGRYPDLFDSALTIQNSIIAENAASTDPDLTAPNDPATNLEVRFSLIGDNTGTTLTAVAIAAADGNLVGTSTDPIDPLLGPLASNGGPTQTHALLASSPAIDAGDNALAVDSGGNPLDTDQRGTPFVRISDGTVDIGAYEQQALDQAIVIFLEGNQHVVRNQTTELLRSPADSGNALVVDAGAGNDSVTIDFGSGFTPPPGGLSVQGGGGQNLLNLQGAGTLDLTDPNIEAGDFPRLQLDAEQRNDLLLDTESVRLLDPAEQTLTVRLGALDRIRVTDVTNWRIAATVPPAGTLNPFDSAAADERRLTGLHQQSGEQIDVWTTRYRTNFLQTADVDNSGRVEAVDALAVINALNRGQRVGLGINIPITDAFFEGAISFFDANSDGGVSPADALAVINALNRQARGQGEQATPQGEQAAAIDQAIWGDFRGGDPHDDEDGSDLLYYDIPFSP